MNEENELDNFTPKFPKVQNDDALNVAEECAHNRRLEQQESVSMRLMTYVTSYVGLNVNKSSFNWTHRQYRISRNNKLFGGELKDKNLNEYRSTLKDTHVLDPDNALQMHAHFPHVKCNKQNKSVFNIIYEKINELIFKEKTNQENASSELPMLKSTRIHRYDKVEVVTRDKVEDDKYENKKGPCDAFLCNKNAVPGNLCCDRLCDNYTQNTDNNELKELLSTIKEHRPYFTSWITFVQIVICLFSLFAYDIAPIGMSFKLKQDLAITINLEKQLISQEIKENFWIGPCVADLIQLGAKYAPCMRNDTSMYEVFEMDRNVERSSACCVRNDRGGCVQVNENECAQLYSTWMNNTVCGNSPDYCVDNFKAAFWLENDITTWPICTNYSKTVANIPENRHLTCEIIGRPCCVGVQGECIITTREHCDVRKGTFHEKAQLCSQVDCMQGVCGMLPFFKHKQPSQVYRIFTSIFIHAGIVQLLLTILFQYFVMRDIEKIAGFVRVAIIYLLSGAFGNLASAIFLPYQAEVGPLGAQSGILACVFVEMLLIRKIYARPWIVFTKMTSVFMFVVLLGFLPMIDNYQNIFGFLTGLFLSFILFPDIAFNDKFNRLVMFIIGVIFSFLLLILLIILFYIKPIDSVEWTKFISCPFGPKFCLNMDFNITRIRYSSF